jgi:hypothetical protein
MIGFVGSKEIMVNGRFVDPMRIRLPRGRVLEGALLANFEKERDHVEGKMNRKTATPDRKSSTPARVAQTTGN